MNTYSSFKEYLLDLDRFIDCLDNICAHTKDNPEGVETLQRHSNLTFKKLLENNDAYGNLSKTKLLIIDIVSEIPNINNIEFVSDFIFKAFLNAIFMHDIGKINPSFQVNTLNNKAIVNKLDLLNLEEITTSNHSIYSSGIYLDIMVKDLSSLLTKVDLSSSEKIYINYFLYIFSYIISRHHVGLDSLEDYMDPLTEVFCEQDDLGEWRTKNKSDILELFFYKENFEGFNSIRKSLFNKKRLSSISRKLELCKREIYLLSRLLYSLLVSSDSLATAEYINDTKYRINVLNISTLIDNYKKSSLYNLIQEKLKAGLKNDSMNDLRCKFFKDVSDNIKSNATKSIFYINGPTGSGKTNTVTNASIELIESLKLAVSTQMHLNSMLYAAPFNTVTNQVSGVLSKLIAPNESIDVVEVNSSSEIKISSKGDDTMYDISLLDYQMLNYPVTLISHVKLFNVLFGINRVDSHSLSQFSNSVIIIDEIQSYTPVVWSRMIELFDVYAKYLNIKFIIMSATLPKLDKFLPRELTKSEYVDLTEDSYSYFKSRFFRNRVNRIDFSLLNSSLMKTREIALKKGKLSNEWQEYKTAIFENIYNILLNIYSKNQNSKVLVEFITVSSCKEFNNYVLDKGIEIFNSRTDFKVCMILGEDNSEIKAKAIKYAKGDNPILLISTQCVEAGVDIDMDYGLKDISYLENEEQFLGRIRRNYDDTKDSAVWFFNLDDASKIYSSNGIDFRAGADLLNFNYRKLFLDKDFDVYFDTLINVISGYQKSTTKGVTNNIFIDALKNLDYKKVKEELTLIKEEKGCLVYIPFTVYSERFKENLDGAKIWNEFKEISKDKEYSEKAVKRQSLLCKMQWFIYEIKVLNGERLIEENKNVILEHLLTEKGIPYENFNGIFYLNLGKEEIDLLLTEDKRLKLDVLESLDSKIRKGR